MRNPTLPDLTFAKPFEARDKWVRIIGIPLAVLPFVLYYAEEYGYHWQLALMTFGLGLVSTGVTWHLLRWWVFWVRERYTEKALTRRRVLITFSGYFIACLLIQPIETWGMSQIDLTGYLSEPEFPRVYLTHIGMALSFAIIVGGYYEITYYLHLYGLAVMEAEALKKAGIQSQFDSLKNQVNPHFLFNSLNSLSALVIEDQQKAGEFLEELASVYRYLLQSSHNALVPLSTELSFIRSFGFLLETRYGSALDFQLRVDDECSNHYLPTLTLQILVENAIRHNVIEVQRPLRILIEVKNDQLTVTNTIQRKAQLVDAKPGGLTNLISQFQALGFALPRITDDSREFCFSLSLAPSGTATEITPR
jgi:hypothetical protein